MSSHEYLRAPSEVKASYWFLDGETQEDSATHIDSSLFTHLFCAFANLDAHTHQVFVSRAHKFKFSSFTETVKKRNPQVQTLLSIGGRNAKNTMFATMASKPHFRKSFIDSSILIARSMGFHGLDLAWEYPNSNQEMTNFGKLLEEWRAAIDDESKSTGDPCLLLTASVYYSSEYNSVSYPVQPIKESLDWVNIIAYDFYTPKTSEVTAPPAALFDPTQEGPCGDSGLKLWLEAGLPQKKAVFGFSYVGWAWALQDARDHGYGAPTTGVAPISADGSIDYIEIKKFIKDDEATEVHDSRVVGDYCYAGTIWIGYDDTQSIVTKVQYAKHKDLLGYFSWNVGADENSVLSHAASEAWDA